MATPTLFPTITGEHWRVALARKTPNTLSEDIRRRLKPPSPANAANPSHFDPQGGINVAPTPKQGPQIARKRLPDPKTDPSGFANRG